MRKNMRQFAGSLCLFMLLVAAVAEEGNQKQEPERPFADLRAAIFKKYNPKLMPVKHPKSSISVVVALEPKFIREFDEENQILSLDAYVHMTWEDKFLKWSKASHPGIGKLVVPLSDIWTPDLSAIIGTQEGMDSSSAVVHSSGKVVWGMLTRVAAHCAANASGDPEELTCHSRFHSRSYDASALELTLDSPEVPLDSFQNSSEWSLVSITATRGRASLPCCSEELYSEIEYEISLRQEHATAVHIVERISLYAVFLCLLMFWLPPDSVHKILLGALSMMMLAFGNFYLGSTIRSPTLQRVATDRTYPLMCFVGAAMCAEVFVINMARMLVHCRPSRCLLGIAKCCCQPFCVCASGPYSKRDIRVLTYMDKGKKHTPTAQEEWNVIAMACDRILFLTAIAVSIFFYKFWWNFIHSP